MTEERSLLGGEAIQMSRTTSSAAGAPSSNASSSHPLLHPAVLSVLLQMLPPQEGAVRLTRVCTAWALASRSDALWTQFLARDWASAATDPEDRPEEAAALAELQTRVQAEARARRGAFIHGMDDEARRKSSIHADVPVLSASALDGVTSVPQSPEQRSLSSSLPTPSTAATNTTTQRRNEEGMPRARSIAALNTLMIPSATTLSNSTGLPDRSPRSTSRVMLNSSPIHQQALGKISSDSGDSSGAELAISPLRRAYSEGTPYPPVASTCAPFSFACPASPRVDRQSVSANRFAGQRFLAPPDSLKAVYADVVRKSYPRFALRSHLAVGERLPRLIKFAVTICLLIAFAAGVSLYRSDDDDGSVNPTSLSLMCTLSTTLLLTLLFANLVRVLRRSLVAKQALWKLPPLPPADASMAEHEHAAAVTAFQLCDQHWWRAHSTNRWHSVRYQVWLSPSARALLVLATGLGIFVMLWVIITLALGSWWPSAAVGIGMLFPAISLVASFQLGRMLRLSRTMHLVLICALSLLQLCALVLLLHAGNISLAWELDYSLALSFAALLGSFAPNLLLLFFALWLHEDYITHGFDAAVLPPQVPGSADFDSADLTSPTSRASQQGGGGGGGGSMAFGNRSPHFFASVARDEESQANSYMASSSSSEHWASVFIPPAHTFGRVLLGGCFERALESRCPLAIRKVLFSRFGLSVLGGLVIYLSTCTYWSSLFALFLDPHVVFPLLPAAVRWFHVISLAAFLLVTLLVGLMAVFVVLQNRSWLWWWTGAHVNAAALALIALHYSAWSASLRRQLHGELEDALAQGLDAESIQEAAIRLRVFDSQVNSHWIYSWTSWLALLCCATALSLGAGVLCMRLLYRPKSVRELLKSAAEAAVAEAKEEAATARRLAFERTADLYRRSPEFAAVTTSTFTGGPPPPLHSPQSHYPSPIIPPLSSSHRYAQQVSASPVLMDSLATLALSTPSYDFDRRLLNGGLGLAAQQPASLSFLQSLHQPASPTVDMHDATFMDHVRDIQMYAAQEQMQQLRPSQFPEAFAQRSNS